MCVEFCIFCLCFASTGFLNYSLSFGSVLMVETGSHNMVKNTAKYSKILNNTYKLKKL